MEGIIIPFFKKGRRDNPSNYRPVNLPSITGKLYTSHVLDKDIDRTGKSAGRVGREDYPGAKFDNATCDR